MDEVDRANALAQHERESSLATTLRRIAAAVAEPPRLSDAGAHCLECNAVIAPARLNALPHANTCIDCAQRAELKQRARARG